jgi:hypothetical protein
MKKARRYIISLKRDLFNVKGLVTRRIVGWQKLLDSWFLEKRVNQKGCFNVSHAGGLSFATLDIATTFAIGAATFVVTLATGTAAVVNMPRGSSLGLPRVIVAAAWRAGGQTLTTTATAISPSARSSATARLSAVSGQADKIVSSTQDSKTEGSRSKDTLLV